jgi:hypothetical protein
MANAPQQTNNNWKKGKNRNQGKVGTPHNKIHKLEETNVDPIQTLKGEITMSNHAKGEITIFEPTTLAHYVDNMVITLTISPKSLTTNI